MKQAIIFALAAGLLASSRLPAAAETTALPGSPFGIAWGFLYGYQGVAAPPYMPLLRNLGAGLSKIYIFWNQVEPRPGLYDWHAVDAYTAQLRDPNEGLISVYSASEWATRRSTAMLPASPPKSLDDYYRFVYALVRHCNGRVRYWENDAEPNSAVYWAGTADEFVDELHVFYRAVKAADPQAVVIVGGYDGWFNPPGLPPMRGQEEGLAFFDRVFARSRDAFDVFDLRLYGDPYTIPARVAYVRERMMALGYEKPIVSTEYGGPNPLEFPQNRKYFSLLATWSQEVAASGGSTAAANPLDDMYAHANELPPQTRMFMQGAPRDVQADYDRLQAQQLVTRSVLGFAAGVQKMIYWQFLAAPGKRDDLMTFMYGKTGMYSPTAGRLPIADVYERMATEMQGMRSIGRIPVPANSAIYCFAVDRGERGTLYVVWRRGDAYDPRDAPSVETSLSWSAGEAIATDTFGAAVPVQLDRGRIRLAVSSTPVYIEPGTLGLENGKAGGEARPHRAD